MANHGTAARYKKHVREKETACDECKEANRIYQNELFRRSPRVHQEENRRKRAVQRAMTRLKYMYPTDYEVLYLDELGKDRHNG